MNAASVCFAFPYRKLARVIVTLAMIFGFAAGVPAQRDTGTLGFSPYSVGQEIPLLNQAMSLTVRADVLKGDSMDLLCVDHTESGAIKITLNFRNKGSAPVRWAFSTSRRVKDSEVILLLEDKKEVAPVADKDTSASGTYRRYPSGSAGFLSTNETKPGETTSQVLLFPKPKTIANTVIKIRQIRSELQGYAPLLPREGILVSTGLRDNN